MVNRIVVAVDDAAAFKDKGCAMNCAGTLARQTGGEVALLHVQPPSSDAQATITPYQYEGIVGARRVEQREHLADTAEALEGIHDRVKASWGVDGDWRATHGEVRRTLRHAVESLAGDLIIARVGDERCPSAYLAQMPEGVIRDTKVPVLFVPGGPCRLMQGVQSVLVPLDGSAGSEEALPLALRLLHGEGSLHLLTVVPASRIEPLRRRGADALRSRAAAERYLESVAARPELADVHLEWNVLDGMPAERAIQDEADRLNVSLVAMSTRAHDGLAGMLLGNVTHEVLKTTRVPLLVHRTGTAAQAA
ncbi:MAG TPA: universal stress protein [Longimicrobiales bacterium]|nr:universal stress protein [Longimicrobiales bacterium]